MTPGEHRRQRGTAAAVVTAGSGAVATYAQLDDRSMQLSRRLHAHGLRAGGRVAVLLHNDPRWFEVAWAVLRSGAHLVPINAHLDPREVGEMLEHSGATVLVTSADFDDTLTAVGPRRLAAVSLRLVIGGGQRNSTDYEAALASQLARPLADERAGEVMFYSGGTTGQPKAVLPLLSGAGFGERPNPLAALFQARWGFGPDTVLLVCAPLYHAGPLGFGLATQRLGGTVVVLPAFDPVATLQAIEEHGVTHALFVPMHLRRLLDLDEGTRRAFDLSSLRCAIHGAAPCPPAVKERTIDWWGKIVHEYYAGSEGAAFTLCDSEEWLSHRGTVGRLQVGTVHVLGEDGAELGPGERGQLWFDTGGPFAYHDDPAATAAAVDERGWTTLGDVGRVDADGFVYVDGRVDELVERGGRAVSLQAVEMALLEHDAVLDGAAVVDDGELVALVQLRTVGDVPAALLPHCRDRLGADGCPDRIEVVDSLPRLPNGKLLKRLLPREAPAAVDFAQQPQPRTFSSP
jgi:acyl-CoA synthetase (AMP-forming)/AMP-acid ligase II